MSEARVGSYKKTSEKLYVKKMVLMRVMCYGNKTK